MPFAWANGFFAFSASSRTVKNSTTTMAQITNSSFAPRFMRPLSL